MRGFLTGPKSVFALVALLVFALWFCLFFCGYTLAKRRNSLHPLERTAILASLVGLSFTTRRPSRIRNSATAPVAARFACVFFEAAAMR
jgi:hypothetical protein